MVVFISASDTSYNLTVTEDYFDIRTFFRYLRFKELNPKEFNILLIKKKIRN